MPTFEYYELSYAKKNYPDALSVSIPGAVVGMVGKGLSLLPSGVRNAFGVSGRAQPQVAGFFPTLNLDGDYFGIGTIDALIQACQMMEVALGAAAAAAGAVTADTTAMMVDVANCAACTDAACPACLAVAQKCAAAWAAATSIFATVLALIIAELTVAYICTDILIPHMDTILGGVWGMYASGDSRGLYKSYSCDDVKTTGSTGKGIPIDGLMIIDIYDVILSTWTVTCNTSQEGVSSWSTAQFDGGDVGTGGYYPRIIKTDSDK